MWQVDSYYRNTYMKPSFIDMIDMMMSARDRQRGVVWCGVVECGRRRELLLVKAAPCAFGDWG